MFETCLGLPFFYPTTPFLMAKAVLTIRAILFNVPYNFDLGLRKWLFQILLPLMHPHLNLYLHFFMCYFYVKLPFTSDEV